MKTEKYSTTVWKHVNFTQVLLFSYSGLALGGQQLEISKLNGGHHSFVDFCLFWNIASY